MGKKKTTEKELQILRLHDIWHKLNNAYNEGRLSEVQFLLDNVWIELIGDVQAMKDKTKLIKNNKTLKEKIAKNKRNRSKYYECLNERHLFLKEIEDRAGKL